MEIDKTTLIQFLEKEAKRIGFGKLKMEIVIQERKVKYVVLTEAEYKIKISDII